MKQILSHATMQIRMGLRDPAYFFSTILLPAGLYWFFAVPESKDAYVSAYLSCSFSAFSFFGVVFLQYSINTAQEKESAWAQYLKTIPTKAQNIIFARFLTSILLGTLSCGLIYALSKALTPSDLSFTVFLEMLFLLILGSVPFLLMGLVIGSIFTAKAVVPVANFLHLVLSFAGGLWKPPEILPKVIQDLAPALPTFHYGKLVWSLSSPDLHIEKSNIIYLLTFTVVMLFALFIIRSPQKLVLKRA